VKRKEIVVTPDRKALVLYDSRFGNTEKVAQAIGAALAAKGEVAVVKVADVRPEQLAGIDLLVVGSPTWGSRPTPAVSRWLKTLPSQRLKGVRVAGFDTRGDMSQVTSRFVLSLVGFLGFAAAPISARLAKKGGTVAVPPEGFVVVDREGPLKEGELERAAEWAGRIAAA
jgi:flavodoxin I